VCVCVYVHLYVLMCVLRYVFDLRYVFAFGDGLSTERLFAFTLHVFYGNVCSSK